MLPFESRKGSVRVVLCVVRTLSRTTSAGSKSAEGCGSSLSEQQKYFVTGVTTRDIAMHEDSRCRKWVMVPVNA